MTQDIKEIADHLRNGRPSTAERKCRQLLAKQPQNPFALHLLGVIASAAGAHKDAVNFIQKAIGIRHDIADFHNSLGAALGQLGRAPAAISALTCAATQSKTSGGIGQYINGPENDRIRHRGGRLRPASCRTKSLGSGSLLGSGHATSDIWASSVNLRAYIGR